MPIDPPTSALLDALNDPARLAALEATGLLDSPPEEAFDRLSRMVAQILDAPVSLVSLVSKDRQFFKSHSGLAEPYATQRELPLSHSFCRHVVDTNAPLVAPDTREHHLLHDNPGLRDLKAVAYLGVPLRTAQGHTLGSVCTLDSKRREWTAREVKILEDLAFSVMTEIELRILAVQFHANYVALRNLELHRDELVQMLVHDLRNPLTSLLGGLELIHKTEGLDPMQRQCVTIARQSGEMLLRMTSDILDVSKAEAGQLGLNLIATAPRSIIDTACIQVKQLAERTGVTLSVDAAAGLPPIQADPEKLRRVLVNLMSNAIQHTPRNGHAQVTARESDDRRAMVFEVADTGTGIAPESFNLIFKKYGQVKARRTDKVSTGLGLPFCKMVIDAHGGSISVESELGQGTTFRFQIPVAGSKCGG